MDTAITVEVVITAPIATVWRAFTTPGEIRQWSAVSDDAHMTECTVDLREGGHFLLRTETKDGRPGPNFEGTFTKVIPQTRLELSYGERTASVQFDRWDDNVAVTVVFNAESEDSITQEQQVALSIMQNFSAYVQAGH
jgi:uncharacterized protein YndB with AHSA1/START domain